MSATCRVHVNNRTLDVPAGTLVTDAARMAEIHVPIFCSHAKLPPLGACRICVVEIGMPRLGPDRKPVLAADGTPEIAWMPKVQTGCTTPVADGMARSLPHWPINPLAAAHWADFSMSAIGSVFMPVRSGKSA